MKDASITILAKAPVAGFAKTRLIPALGPAGAAAVAMQLLDHTVTEALAAGLGEVRLLGAPDATHPAFKGYAASLRLGAQSSGDLGLRMHTALSDALATHPLALLVGTDAPALDRSLLRSAAKALLRHDAVFVPALDGGYALVGLRGRSWPELFEGMTWSTDRVMADTRARLQRLGLRWHELPAVSDIDEPTDLAHLPEGWLA
ncbi:TIGR04282 family arsenosugar biosynthesis glycosyltransferase [Roseateles paludis]|uniref:TIGR04282 family arsenosugar biosynthesis glycosyltransferase n=1 Tax=Roseateles paludis TaxID=3145238 RepID=A0ABV0FZJ0_9BURK